MGLYRKFVNQTRKPEGTLGKMMVNGMNSGHAKMADWGMFHLPEMNPSKILEVGCGGGRNAGELAKKYPAAMAIAITKIQLITFSSILLIFCLLVLSLNSLSNSMKPPKLIKKRTDKLSLFVRCDF